MFYAHTKGSSQEDWQILNDHLRNTAKLALTLNTQPKLDTFIEIISLLHDAGKYSQAFQKRLLGASQFVDHSTAGAQLLLDLADENKSKAFVAKLLAFCITGHHSGLPDYGSIADHYSSPTLCGRLKRPIDDYSAFHYEFSSSEINIPNFLPIKPIRKKGQFSFSFFVRMLYSTLVDADYLETEAFIRGGLDRGNYPTIHDLNNQFNQFISKYKEPVSRINQKRTELLNICLDQADSEPGLFSMTIPTGGGKTYTSLAFALEHAKKHHLRRIIYCVPFTTIIEQNAAVIRTCLGEDNVLEHHSNFDWRDFSRISSAEGADDQTNVALEKLKLASENWDIPIIVTTNVQFFESMFSNRSSRCRKLHSIMDSVVILDEAQMLPQAFLEPCMLGLAELIQNYGTSVIFCTATQPPLNKMMPQTIQQKDLIPEPEETYDFFKRVSVVNLESQTDNELMHKLNSHTQVLCIVNTRKHANGLFGQLEQQGRFHLSTLMCPAHRKSVVEKIKMNLADGRTCRVVSTQIMEAGIDVDFPVGYRALAGLDSIVQASGRVNREGKRNSGTLYVFQPKTDFIKRVPAYIRQTAGIAGIVMEEFEDPISIEALSAYYQLLFDLQDPQNFDRLGIMDHFEKGILDEPDFDFKTAAEKFKMIENDTVSVIIPWDDNAVELIKRLRFIPEPASLLRSLQPYTVNIYPQEFSVLEQYALVEILHERFAVLSSLEEAYNPETGLVIPDDAHG